MITEVKLIVILIGIINSDHRGIISCDNSGKLNSDNRVILMVIAGV